MLFSLTFVPLFDNIDPLYLHHHYTQESGMDCIFCNIVKRAAPAEILYEDTDVLAILDVRPIHYGHTLVLPKRHYKDFLEVPEAELAGIMSVTQRVAAALVQSFQLSGFNFFANNGKIAGQSVFHFHIHITPRYAADNIRFELKLKEYEGTGMAETAAMIRTTIQSL
jgi:histidine triad (HIT) family protein